MQVLIAEMLMITTRMRHQTFQPWMTPCVFNLNLADPDSETGPGLFAGFGLLTSLKPLGTVKTSSFLFVRFSSPSSFSGSLFRTNRNNSMREMSTRPDTLNGVEKRRILRHDCAVRIELEPVATGQLDLKTANY